MYLTFIFYFVIFLLCLNKNKNRAIAMSAFVIAMYLGLRYDYMYDYQSYYNYFNEVANVQYEQTSHMEIGWYYINRFFQPIGYFGFVFVTSCIFAAGLYLVWKDLAIFEYLLFAILAFVTTSSFSVISSAQRQMLVTGIFFIAWHFLIQRKITSLKSLFSGRSLLFYLTIFLCSFIHSSSLFLLIVPFIYLIPPKSTIVSIIMAILFLGELIAGDLFFPTVLPYIVDQYGDYDHLLSINRDYDTVSWIGTISYVIQATISILVYRLCNLSKEQKVCVILYFISILLFMSINYAFQIFRLGLYINLSVYISIGIILYSIKDKKIRLGVSVFYLLWCIQNALFIFNVQPGTVEEYKTIFSVM